MKCDVVEETCKNGICMCGKGASCGKNSQAPFCDAENDKCYCGDNGGDKFECNIDGETCVVDDNGLTVECKCGGEASCFNMEPIAPNCNFETSECYCFKEGDNLVTCEDDETCEKGMCMGGEGGSGRGNSQAPFCDAENDKCYCGENNGDKFECKIEGETCVVDDNGLNVECKCGGEASCFNMEPIAPNCNVETSECYCFKDGDNLVSCEKGKTCENRKCVIETSSKYGMLLLV